MQAKASGELLGWGCPFFDCLLSEVSGWSACVCVCMHGGDEEGECKARLGRLSGGIKALLQW